MRRDYSPCTIQLTHHSVARPARLTTASLGHRGLSFEAGEGAALSVLCGSQWEAGAAPPPPLSLLPRP